MIIFPNQNAPFVGRGFNIKPPWNSYLQQFTQAPPGVIAATVGASPFSFVAAEPGILVITGGTVTAVHLVRGLIDLNITGSIIVPVAINDTVIVTYAVLPALNFLPAFGVNTQ